MFLESYRELKVWQKSIDLVLESYELTGKFPKAETYGLVSQLQRAAVSIPANIAEGHARRHTKEFLQHINIAYGSLAELETHGIISEKLGCTTSKFLKGFLGKTSEIGKMLNGLRNSLEKKLNPAP